ncbi:hypothetical protein COT64_02230 [Candidatus Shapirobacteria bacterium CG09_land_8_20_14_0_10_39_12]|uniref:HNH nuclease domain-containing protein n=1 Tax=Candidatus Shapirobacteria bacterium CG09_land_8_20_14_0_10_39_12 TaxID=1974885 RepID=A0A2H0WPF3_9BACT|nr:MAG: hypothetical protein COT64_02230 [Candidatus Shapirobacteria bacterium CG09_land_8_20_14_0_10_39_12]
MPFIKCQICSKKFYVKPSHQELGWGKYCSTKCRSTAQLRGKKVKCFTCGKKIYRSPKLLSRSKSKKYFCCKSCQTLWRNKQYIKEQNINWINGKKSYRNILIRNTIKPVCELCKITDERVLVAHHIDHDRENNNLKNLVWLCLNCHYLVHNFKDFENYINNKQNGGVCRTV